MKPSSSVSRGLKQLSDKTLMIFLLSLTLLAGGGRAVAGETAPSSLPGFLQHEAVMLFQYTLETKAKSIEPEEGLQYFAALSRYWEAQGKETQRLEAEWYRRYYIQLAHPDTLNEALFAKDILSYALEPRTLKEWGRLILAITCWYKTEELYAGAFRAFREIEKNKDRTCLGIRIYDCYYHMAMLSYIQPDYPRAIDYYLKVLRSPDSIAPGLIRNANLYIGWSYRYHGIYDSALFYLEKYRLLIKDIAKPADLTDAQKYIANIYELQGKYYKALSEYLKALSVEEEKGLKENQAWTRNAIGKVYLKLGDIVTAGKYLKSGLLLYEETKTDHGIASSHADLGEMYLKEGDLEHALDHHRKALEIRRKRNRHGYSESLSAIASIYLRMGDTATALDHLEQSLQRSQSTGMRRIELHVLLTFAEIVLDWPLREQEIQLQRFGFADLEALMNYISMLKEETNIPENRLQSLKILSSYYEKTGNAPLSLQFMKEFNAYRDSVFNARQIIEIQDLKNKHLLTAKENEITRLELESKKRELELAKQKNLTQKAQMYWAFGLAGLFLIFMLFIQRMRYRQKRKEEAVKLEAEKLAEIESHKNRFFANMTHEFRTPLTLIEAPLQVLLQKTDNQMHRKLLQIIGRNSKRLKRLSYQILEINKIKNNKVKLHVEEVNICRLIHDLYDDFLPLARREMIGLEMELPDREIIALLDRNLIEEVLLNLLSNAMKFSQPGSNIRMELKNNDSGLEIHVKDEGRGMSREVRERIFERYFTESTGSHGYSEGTGLGLSIAKAYAEAHGGKIEVKSEEGVGTCMMLMLPVHYFFTGEQEKKFTGELPLYIDQQDDDEECREQSCILLVEDNSDLRYFIKEMVFPDCRVLLAKNGIEGIALARERVPDIIISDIMMPDMDGVELLEALKKEPETDHIPFVFLTARATPDSKLEGIRQGADAYIEKPFSAEELQLVVKNLLKRLQQWREKYSAAGIEAETPGKHPFIKKIEELIEKNLDIEDFNVSVLCREFNLSRSQLHRKAKALSGVGPNKLIRNYRLHRAQEFLKSGKYHIAEVAYKTGFSSPSYFAKCFKELFGVAPSEISVL